MNYKNFFIVFGLILLTAGLVIYPSETAEAAKSGISLCANSVIPALFPFFVLSGYIIESKIAKNADLILRRVMRRLFHLNGACATPLALGLIGGYPIGAYSTVYLYKKDLCTKEDADRLLGFCNNSGPAFILGAVGCAVYNNMKIGALLLVIHILSSVTLGIATGLGHKTSTLPNYLIIDKKISTSFSSAFSSAVSSALKSCLNIGAFIVFFSVILRLLNLFQIIPVISYMLGSLLSPFGLDFNTISVLLTGAVEVTTGLFKLSTENINITKSFILSAFMLGFAGFSIHSQTISFIAGSGLSIKRYLFGKLLHGFFSAGFAGIISLFIPLNTTPTNRQAFAWLDYRVFELDIKSYVLLIFITLSILCFLVNFLKRCRKIE